MTCEGCGRTADGIPLIHPDCPEHGQTQMLGLGYPAPGAWVDEATYGEVDRLIEEYLAKETSDD